ncbi:MAG: DNA cytosine methyltransferase [Candidatus Omnitrophica bacterium]|nr:DNA cytosine methyltransferase [Candidatus Omnitrophota bacterium]
MKKSSISAVDLFCGVGGLTHGLIKSGINVVAGIDVDEGCRFAFEKNNKALFIHKSVKEVASQEISDLYPQDNLRILVGCAPC